MRNSKRIVLVVLMVAGLIAGLAAAPARAVPPTVVRESFPLVVADTGDCAFPVALDYWVRGTMWTHYDQNGNPVVVRFHTKMDGTATNTDNGKSTRTHHNWTETYDLAAGTLTLTGIPFGSWEITGGPVLYSMGRLVFDLGAGGLLFQAGRDNFEGDFSRVCPTLS